MITCVGRRLGWGAGCGRGEACLDGGRGSHIPAWTDCMLRSHAHLRKTHRMTFFFIYCTDASNSVCDCSVTPYVILKDILQGTRFVQISQNIHRHLAEMQQTVKAVTKWNAVPCTFRCDLDFHRASHSLLYIVRWPSTRLEILFATDGKSFCPASQQPT